MPHRVQFLSFAMNHTIEGLLLLSIAIVQGGQTLLGVISEADWLKFTGPHGFLFGAIIAIGVLWNSGRIREKNESARRDKEELAREARHAELVQTNKHNAESLMKLTVESILAQGKATRAVEAMDNNIQRLTHELAERPCQAPAFRPPGAMPTTARE